MESLTPEQAFQLQTAVMERVAGRRSSWVMLAANLSAFHACKGWEALEVDSFDEWLAQPEISLNRSEAFRMIAAWALTESGVAPAQLERLDLTKVAVVLPAIKKGADVEECLADCEVLSRSDLREKYGRGGGETEYRVCPECGQKVKVKAEEAG